MTPLLNAGLVLSAVVVASIVLYRLAWVADPILDRHASRPLSQVDDEGLWLARAYDVHGADHIRVTTAVEQGLLLDTPHLRHAAAGLAARRLERDRRRWAAPLVVLAYGVGTVLSLGGAVATRRWFLALYALLYVPQSWLVLRQERLRLRNAERARQLNAEDG